MIMIWFFSLFGMSFEIGLQSFASLVPVQVVLPAASESPALCSLKGSFEIVVKRCILGCRLKKNLYENV